MFPFFLWALFGAFVGWLASLVVGAQGRQGWTIGNIVVGTFGAGLGGALFQRDMGTQLVSAGSVITALWGAVILLAIANIFMLGRTGKAH